MAMSVIDLNSGIQGVLEYMSDKWEGYGYSVLTMICEVLCGGNDLTHDFILSISMNGLFGGNQNEILFKS